MIRSRDSTTAVFNGEDLETLVASARSLILELEVIRSSTRQALMLETVGLTILAVLILSLATVIALPSSLRIQLDGQIASFIPALFGLTCYVGFYLWRDYRQKQIVYTSAQVAQMRIERAVLAFDKYAASE